MKQKLLLTLFIASLNFAVNAQKNTTYAITGSQKGQNNWSEIRLIDVTSGEEVKTVFKTSEETKILNARTGKPIVKKDSKEESFQYTKILPVEVTSDVTPENNLRMIKKIRENALVSSTALQAARSKEEIDKIIAENNAVTVRVRPNVNVNTNVNTNTNVVTTHNITIIRDKDGNMQVSGIPMVMRVNQSLDKPFSTFSAAAAYDKKHERLYYTPLGIAQLRYIDLKSKTPEVFYFEDEQFGALRSRNDVPNQITRMVIGADGDGYALTNNAEHLIKFTTSKKAVITDLGSLSDDAGNGKFSVHNPGGYGGDIIAAKSGDLYLITANHNIFQINIKNLTATYKGTIQGLPRGYSTNGAAVEEGTMVLVNSSNSTQGYYHFDINKLVAEKVGNGSDVYNASDLANGNLLAVKKDKKEEQPQQVVPQTLVETVSPKEKLLESETTERSVSAYPNPVTSGSVTLSFENYLPGRYQAQLIDISGKQLSSKYITITGKSQTERFDLPQLIAKGNYLIQIVDQSNKNAGTNKLVVQ